MKCIFPMILASQSPRRRELLSLYGLPFTVIPSDAPENDASPDCKTRVQALARLKCEDIAARYPDRLVLGADTLVCLGEHILGKPKTEAEARAMLRLLSGQTHVVYTGVCLHMPDEPLKIAVSETSVTLMPLTDAQINSYIATGEPMDKAGAYAIQGQAGVFVQKIEGSPTNVIGLPLEIISRWFSEMELPFFMSSKLL